VDRLKVSDALLSNQITQLITLFRSWSRSRAYRSPQQSWKPCYFSIPESRMQPSAPSKCEPSFACFKDKLQSLTQTQW
jgi:hypothetical protein